MIVMTAADRQTGLFTALSIPAKKPEKDYVVKSLKAFVSQLGHLQVAIRSDDEPQILTICNELRDELNKLRGKEVVAKAYTEQAPCYSPQSMGAVGSAQKTLKGDFLTLRSALEEKIGIQVTPATCMAVDDTPRSLDKRKIWSKLENSLRGSAPTQDKFSHLGSVYCSEFHTQQVEGK